MTLLEQLACTDAPVITDIITRNANPGEPTGAAWDNNPTWDNWSNTTSQPWNNQPTWDNWSKKS